MAFLKRFLTPSSIGRRFAVAIGSGASFILIVLSVANYLNARELLLQQTSSEALKEVNDEMRTMDDLVNRIAMLPYVIGATQIENPKGDGVTVAWLDSLLKACPIPAVYGLYMTLDDRDWHKPGLSVDRKSGIHPPALRYDFHDPSQEWYRVPRESGKLFVTPPYYDAGGSDIDMISITQPVYSHKGAFIGVAGADVDLEEMRRIVRSIHIRNFGDNLTGVEGIAPSFQDSARKKKPINLQETAFLISPQGSLIVGPAEHFDQPAPKPGDTSLRNAESLCSELRAQGLSINPAGIQKILSSSGGWIRLKDGEEKVVYWAQGRITGWKLILIVPYKLIVAPARILAIQSGLIGGVGIILLLVVILATARKVSEPINQLQHVASDLEKGSCGHDDERGGILQKIMLRPDELGRFARSFSTMAREIRLREERLTEWNVNLEKTIRDRTADLARAMEEVKKSNKAMASELAEAAAYTRAVLPARLEGPILTDWVFEPSSQLGGDSFGYHWLDAGHLSLYLLDVCGHGVGAALLSISVLNVLRTSSLAETDFLSPSAVMTGLNQAFPMDHQNEMYFTAWYGVYELETGRLRFSCGGHPPAILIPPAPPSPLNESSGVPILLSVGGPVMGVFANIEFKEAYVEVPPGSRLYLFSDGVYEVDLVPGNVKGDSGIGRMMSYDDLTNLLVHPEEETTPQAILAKIRAIHGLDEFEDDFSLIEFRFPGVIPESLCKITLRNNPEELERLQCFTSKFISQNGLSPKELPEIDLILEELVTNVMKYGGIGAQMELCSISLFRQGQLLAIEISDRGNPFNPLKQDDVDTGKPILERPIGGLGIHFVRKLTLTQHYEYKNGMNILTLTKTLIG